MLSQLARAFTDLEERKRILRMRPKPRDIDVTAMTRKQSQTTMSSDSVPADQLPV